MESSTFGCSYVRQEIPPVFSAETSKSDLRSELLFQTWLMHPGKQLNMVDQTLLGLSTVEKKYHFKIFLKMY